MNTSATLSEREKTNNDIAHHYGEEIARIVSNLTNPSDMVKTADVLFLHMYNDRKGGEIIASRRNGFKTAFIVRTDVRGELYDGHYHIDTISPDGTIEKGLIEEHDTLIQRLFDAVDMGKI